MPFTAHKLPYEQTAAFSRIVLDYLAGAPQLNPFYAAAPDSAGLKALLQKRQNFGIDRGVLVDVLEAQYNGIATSEAVQKNISALKSDQTFTVCTAHQPNLATGPLYFIYKILHAIKLAHALNEQYPGQHFVPVYYMGSEDADLEELNHFSIQGKRYVWNTAQKGAVGRMKIDAALLQLISEAEGQLAPFAYGQEVAALLRRHFVKDRDIKTATFGLVNELFASFGLLILIPDSAALKTGMLPVFEKELFDPASSALVAQTSEKLAQYYNAQAQPRDINLFYLEDGIRERIIRTDRGFGVNNTELNFSEAQMLALLHEHPERFSPNVILRGLLQETVLPNIAFIGGGGELAYWMQLKDVFDHYNVSFPVLILRNSFLLLEQKWKARIDKLDISINDCFQKADHILKNIAVKKAEQPLALNGKWEEADRLFEAIRLQAAAIDPTLSQHVAAIKKATLNKMEVLEKKMLRAEKRKHADGKRQIEAMRQHLFPQDGLQERSDNFFYYYAVYGPALVQALYKHSGTTEQQFTVLEINEEG
jgi:bacillithiol synthase